MKRFVALGAVLIGGSLLAAPTAGATLVCPPGVTNPAYCQNVTPPSVTTGPPVPAPPAGATLTGSVNPNGAQTTYSFQYGTTTSYGQTSTAGSIPASTTTQNVQQTITGLTPGTTYHYRLVAKNAGGETLGADQTFTLCKSGITTAGFCASGNESHVILHGHATGGSSGKKFFVLVQLSCTAGEGCEGTVYIEPNEGSTSKAHTAAETIYGSTAYTIAGNGSAQVKIPLNSAGAAVLTNTGKLNASVFNVSKGVRTFAGNISIKAKKAKKKKKKKAQHVTHATGRPGFTG